MKKALSTLAILLIANSAKAQTDSLSMAEKTHNLQEVVIKSDVAMTSAEKSTYLPTRKQRNAATDAVALLQHMMIPQLRINANSQSISTISGDEVSIFIDFMPATAQDLEGMNTQDVKRVEVYDFPSDVRFQNKAHVVNFVMQRYEIGGYTKLSLKQKFLTDNSGSAPIYSKLAYRNWTFDANATASQSKQKHLGSETTETFRLPEQTITRTENFADGKQENRQKSFSLRATFQNQKMQLSNRLELLDNNTPTQELQGSVLYSPEIFTPSASLSRQDTRNITPTYQGDWNFMLPKQWMLSVKPKFQYSHNKQNRFYQEGESQPIENRIKEDTHDLEWEIALGKTFAKKHSLFLGTFGLDYGSEMDYIGSTVASQDMSFLALGFPVIYKFHTQRLSLSAQLIATYQHYTVSGEKKSEWSPIIRTTANYAFNQKNSLAADFAVQRVAADGAKRNPSVLQRNEILYYSGNPLVNNYNNFIGKIQYTWMPSNTFTASAFVQHIYDKNYYANIWHPYGESAILQTLDNVGDAHTTNLGASLTLHLLDENLEINASPTYAIHRTSGVYDQTHRPFNLSLQATYYLGSFYLSAGYDTPEETYTARNAALRSDRSTYYFIAGWGNRNWKFKLDCVNLFRTDWRSTHTTIATPLYTQTSDAFNSSSHQRLNLTVSYTFNYGKKVKRGDELGTASSGQSSIL